MTKNVKRLFIFFVWISFFSSFDIWGHKMVDIFKADTHCCETPNSCSLINDKIQWNVLLSLIVSKDHNLASWKNECHFVVDLIKMNNILFGRISNFVLGSKVTYWKRVWKFTNEIGEMIEKPTYKNKHYTHILWLIRQMSYFSVHMWKSSFVVVDLSTHLQKRETKSIHLSIWWLAPN